LVQVVQCVDPVGSVCWFSVLVQCADSAFGSVEAGSTGTWALASN